MARQLSTPQKLALRHAGRGALYRRASGSWYCRAAPAQTVFQPTIDALVERGLLVIEQHMGLYAPRICARLTPEGALVEAGGAPLTAKPPPVAAETVLHEVELAIAEMDARIAGLQREAMRASASVRETRQIVARIEASMAATERSLLDSEAARERLERTRINLQCLVQIAGERLGDVLAEAGR